MCYTWRVFALFRLQIDENQVSKLVGSDKTCCQHSQHSCLRWLAFGTTVELNLTFTVKWLPRISRQMGLSFTLLRLAVNFHHGPNFFETHSKVEEQFRSIKQLSRVLMHPRAHWQLASPDSAVHEHSPRGSEFQMLHSSCRSYGVSC